MNSVCVKAENLAKKFLVFREEKTTFRVLNSLIQGKPFRKEFWALKDVSFEIKRGDKLAIVGRNGSGKTTLLRILTGIYDKTSGDLLVEGNPKALLKLHIGLKADLPVLDNIYLFGAVHEVYRDVLKGKMEEILTVSGLGDLRYMPIKELSVGQLQRLLLSVFFEVKSDFLIFDEVFASVDQEFTQKCDSYFQNLFSSDKTVIMISHDVAFLKKFCKTAVWLDGGVVRMQGGIDEVLSEYGKSFSK